MDMQNVSNLTIPEGEVKAIHNSNNQLLWGRVNYNTKYAGDIFQQTYTGKNLAKTTNTDLSSSGYTLKIADGYISVTSTASDNGFDLCGGIRTGQWAPNYAAITDYNLTPADEGTYAVSFYDIEKSGLTANYIIRICTNQRNIDKTANQSSGPANFSVTLANGEYIKAIALWTNGSIASGSLKFRTQIEKGTATSYEPYTAGPSPNPEYPQNVNVVTGMQTITITDGGAQSQTYAINLGSTELCKIGDYQDYIYKSGDDWYIHKEVNSFSLATINPWAKASGGRGFYKTSFSANYGFIAQNQLYSNILLYSPTSWTANGIGINSSGDLWINPGDSTITTSDAFIQWLSSKNAIMYGAIITPTDTQITDATLIGQLNAVHEWLTRYGYNATVTGNLPLIIDKTNL